MLDDALVPGDPIEDGALPCGDVVRVDFREVDGVAGDVADEVRVIVREVILHGDDLLAPVLGHQVKVELLDGVQRGQPAEERHEVVVRTTPQELKCQVEPDPLASVVGALRATAVHPAHAKLLVEQPVPGVVDVLLDGDDEVEVAAVAAEVDRVGRLVELVHVLADECAKLPGGGAEEVHVLCFFAEPERTGDEPQVGPEVHESGPFVSAFISKPWLGVSSLSKIQDEFAKLVP